MKEVSKLASIVKGYPKAPFLIATTLCEREGATPFPGLPHSTLDPYLIRLSVKQGDIEYHFLSLWYDSTWDWTPVSQAIDEHSNHHANVQYYEGKSKLKCFGFNEPSSGLYNGETSVDRTMIDV